MKTFINMLRDQSGASAAEYALILAIVGSAIAIAALALGNAVANSTNKASNCITTPSFVVAIFLLLVFSLALHWLPVTGAGDPSRLGDRLAHLILPATQMQPGVAASEITWVADPPQSRRATPGIVSQSERRLSSFHRPLSANQPPRGNGSSCP